jgi:hypothetical protein
VERQEVRLRGDPRNQVDDVADAARGGRKPRHSGARFLRLRHGALHHRGRLDHLPVDLLD